MVVPSAAVNLTVDSSGDKSHRSVMRMIRKVRPNFEEGSISSQLFGKFRFHATGPALLLVERFRVTNQCKKVVYLFEVAIFPNIRPVIFEPIAKVFRCGIRGGNGC